jgi:hypothetical protein
MSTLKPFLCSLFNRALPTELLSHKINCFLILEGGHTFVLISEGLFKQQLDEYAEAFSL